MRKKTLFVIATSLLLMMFPLVSTNATATSATSGVLSERSELAKSNALMERLEVINKMDKSNMSASEKRDLRLEVKSMRESSGRGGIYISVGALILIILVLAILL